MTESDEIEDLKYKTMEEDDTLDEHIPESFLFSSMPLNFQAHSRCFLAYQKNDQIRTT